MKLGSKRLISASITGGIHSPTMSPYLPVNSKDIARQALDAAKAGAAVVHIHARCNETGKPSAKLEDFGDIIGMIREENDDVIICVTTGGGLGMTMEERTRAIPIFKPALASLNVGSINWGLFPLVERYDNWKHDWEVPFYEGTREAIFPNTFKDIENTLNLFREHNVMPEFECYDVGHIYNLKFLKDTGQISGKIYMQFVLGINGALGASPEDVIMMKQTADRLFGQDNYIWSAFGAGRHEFPVCTQSLFLGGNVRVGLEDNLYLSKGVLAKSNAELVDKMVRIMGEFSYTPMTPTEAREMFGISK
ncbi:MAG: 3-keto-5-aminohexanoate cleavage protein [Defluviitaleaceae bacterium]|nr:3-keto-5-aminohexanoate cleavage protein [Defluviitaleaceae bacterium]